MKKTYVPWQFLYCSRSKKSPWCNRGHNSLITAKYPREISAVVLVSRNQRQIRPKSTYHGRWCCHSPLFKTRAKRNDCYKGYVAHRPSSSAREIGRCRHLCTRNILNACDSIECSNSKTCWRRSDIDARKHSRRHST